MNIVGALTACAGSWRGTNTLQDPNTGKREESSSSATVTPVLGSYAAPPGPDWGWRIDITPDDKQTFRIIVFNIWPDGREELAVAASYTRT